MFRVSTRTRYAIWALMELALAGEHGRLSLHTISEKHKLSYKYLESVFTILRKSNLVRSLRGPEGGYELIKAAGELTMLDIIDSLEGPLESVPCANDPGFCNDAAGCSMRDFFREMDDGIIHFLKSKNLKWFIDRSVTRRERRKS